MDDAELADLKDVLRAGRATNVTVLRLQTLFHQSASPRCPDNVAISARRRPARDVQSQRQRPGAQTNSTGGKSRSVVVREDDPAQLTAREQYALATDVVNICLKFLANSSTRSEKLQARPSPSRRSILEHASLSSDRGLQSRPVNSTPTKPASVTPKRSKTFYTVANDSTQDVDSSPHIIHTAECAQQAFAHLRSIDPKAIGVRAMPAWQLESGLLSLSGSLSAHGLNQMAVKPLRLVKRSLETHFALPSQGKMKNPSSGDVTFENKETIIALLELKCAPICGVEALKLAVSYYTRILKLVVGLHKPAIVDGLLQCLRKPPNCPVDLISRQMEADGDPEKAARQLDQLSRLIFSTCPSTEEDADEATRRAPGSPSPGSVFQLQIVALDLRNSWCRVAMHNANLNKELLEPFRKCATAFMRRSHVLGDTHPPYEIIASAFRALMSEYDDTKLPEISKFPIYDMLFLSAKNANLYKEARTWTTMMLAACSRLEKNHVLRLVAITREFVLLPSCRPSRIDAQPLLDLLSGGLIGSAAEHESLLNSLNDVMRFLLDDESLVNPIAVNQLSTATAKYALKYAGAYPSQNLLCAREILDVAVRINSTTERLSLWITRDVSVVFVKTGVLASVAKIAAIEPLCLAWSSSVASLSFSRILQALILKSVRSKEDFTGVRLFDDETLIPSERGTLLEWQLMYILSLTNKVKYREKVGNTMNELLRTLSRIYCPAVFPLRRARLAVAIIKLRQCQPRIVPPHLFKLWSDTQLVGDLGEDTGLLKFLEDMQATLAVARLFLDNRPTLGDLKPSFQAWNRLCNSTESPVHAKQSIYDPNDLISQLLSIAAYFAMLGEDYACLATRKLLVRVTEVCNGASYTLFSALLELARQYLELGYAEDANLAMERAHEIMKTGIGPSLSDSDYHIACAEYFILTDNLERCRTSLNDAQQDLEPLREKLSASARTMYAILNARVWLTHSACFVEAGNPPEALKAGKHAVKILNKIWSSIERSHASPARTSAIECDESTDCAVQTLTKAVSKLHLQPKGTILHTKAKDDPERGAAFWTLVPMLCKALIRLSDMYVHHGIFHEANEFSLRAIQVAESIGSTALLSRLRSHRACLLVLAGRIQDAELCLAQDEDSSPHMPSLSSVERYLALARVRGQDDPREASLFYDRAEDMLTLMMDRGLISRVETFVGETSQPGIGCSSPFGGDPPTEASASIQVKTKRSTHDSKTATAITKQGLEQKRLATRPKAGLHTSPDASLNKESCHVLLKMRNDVRIQRAIIQASLGHSIYSTLEKTERSSLATMKSFGYLHAEYLELMHKASTALQDDVVLNVLRESTLCMPARRQTEPIAARSKAVAKPLSKAVSTKSTVKSAMQQLKKHGLAQHDAADSLVTARDVLTKAHSTRLQSFGAPNIHRSFTMLLKTELLLSSIAKAAIDPRSSSPTASYLVDLPRCHALESERYAVSMKDSKTNSGDLAWPIPDSNRCSQNHSVPDDFQRDFVNILPRTWSAVSLCLNEDASELYIARYDSHKTPLILRIPFSRHKPDALEEDVFSFYQGKAALQEIIDLSNYSCHHNPGDVDVKALKTKWWNERQALDRRLQELLINIENVWFGGFRGIFAQFADNADAFLCFRQSFEDILTRHLPSRQASKRQTGGVSLDDRVLELFIGLGSEDHGAGDLDEPISDLLYFVVDMLQFGGERNAYDEIDFDGMAVDVQDALRSYHDISSSAESETRHLILVLDRRLQAFPWESLPCMESSNISRVGSMLSLRERILAQRAMKGRKSYSDQQSSIPATGTYILNPGSDLPRTQAMLEPSLSKLTTGWDRLVAEAPDETRFTSAIVDSSILLYFGHGPGSQYIRAGTIRRQASCCNVAWLMGCSSGAVTENGDLEPSSVPLAYLLAGAKKEGDAESEEPSGLCKAVVATLWDVTDKDIDRFSLRLGEEWGLWPPSEESKLPTKTPRKRNVVAAPSTPQRAPKTPKTPKVVKSPAPFKTPLRTRGRNSKKASEKTSLVEALSRSREACYLRYLNGAAPVMYGIPVYLE